MCRNNTFASPKRGVASDHAMVSSHCSGWRGVLSRLDTPTRAVTVTVLLFTDFGLHFTQAPMPIPGPRPARRYSNWRRTEAHTVLKSQPSTLCLGFDGAYPGRHIDKRTKTPAEHPGGDLEG